MIDERSAGGAEEPGDGGVLRPQWRRVGKVGFRRVAELDVIAGLFALGMAQVGGEIRGIGEPGRVAGGAVGVGLGYDVEGMSAGEGAAAAGPSAEGD